MNIEGDTVVCVTKCLTDCRNVRGHFISSEDICHYRKRLVKAVRAFDSTTNFVENEPDLLPRKPKSSPFCTPLVNRGQMRRNVRGIGDLVRPHIGGHAQSQAVSLHHIAKPLVTTVTSNDFPKVVKLSTYVCIRKWNCVEYILRIILSKRFKSKQALAFKVLLSIASNVLSLTMPEG